MLYSVIVPALCIIGIGTGSLIIVFSVRNLLKKQYRLFSVIYAAVSGVVLYILMRMLTSIATGFVCARDPVVTLIIYLGIDVLLLFFLSDSVLAGKKRIKPEKTNE